MSSQRQILTFVILLTMLVSGAIAQDWTPTSAPPVNWSCLASSADGRKLVGGDYFSSRLIVSTNSGSTWSPTSSPTNEWSAVACSADGSVILAASAYARGSVYVSGLYVSRDSGATWTLATDGFSGWSVACSADGKRMATAYDNAVYISTNYGSDWVLTNAFTPKGVFPKVTMSADGSRLALATGGSSIETSTNFGLTWIPSYPTKEPMYHMLVATSGEGGTLMVLSAPTDWSPELISLSSDWGATWRAVGSITNVLGSNSGACSADGAILAVAQSRLGGMGDTVLVLSTNSGAVWSTQFIGDTNLCSVVCSVDGSRLAAALGDMFRPSQSVHVRQTTPMPLLKVLSAPGGLELSWLLPSEPFVLQESPNLLRWSPVGATPPLNYTSLHYVVNLPAPIVPKFYRLVSQ